MMSRLAMLAAATIFVSGCTTVRATSPARTTQEMLLITTAADRAAEALAAQVPPNLTAWIDTSGFSAQDAQYGLATIQDALLRHGVKLVADRAKADAVILPRAGTLSTDERNTLVGVPALPNPFMPGVGIPALALYSQSDIKGTAKFAATIYDNKTGKLIVSTDPAYGFSRENDGTVLIFYTWRKNDVGVDFSQSPPKVSRPENGR
jgi:hypothetical protein